MTKKQKNPTRKEKMEAAAVAVASAGTTLMIGSSVLDNPTDSGNKLLRSILEDNVETLKQALAIIVGVDTYNKDVGPKAQQQLEDAFTRASLQQPANEGKIVTDTAEGVAKGH